MKKIWEYRKQFLSLLVGVPSYEKYVEHMETHHPGGSAKPGRRKRTWSDDPVTAS